VDGAKFWEKMLLLSFLGKNILFLNGLEENAKISSKMCHPLEDYKDLKWQTGQVFNLLNLNIPP
jgi:hypothetical protein